MIGELLGALGTGVGSALGGAAVGGLLGAGGRDDRQTLQQQQDFRTASNQTLRPISAANPLYSGIAGIGQQVGGTATPFFPGQGYVGPSGPTTHSINAGMGTLPLYGAAAQQMRDAQHGMRGLIGQGWNNYNFLSNAADVGQNPYVQGMMQQNADLLNRNFNEQLMPSIRGSAIGVNNLGSSRQGIAEGVAARGTQEAISDANERLLLGAYGQGLGAQQTALGSTGAMLNNLLAPAQATAGAADINANAARFGLGLGQTVEGYQRQALDDAMARFYHQYQEPWSRMANMGAAAGLLQPLGMQESSGLNNQNTQAQNPNYQSLGSALAQGAIGGGLTGWGMYQDWRRNNPPQLPSGNSLVNYSMNNNAANFGTFPAYFS